MVELPVYSNRCLGRGPGEPSSRSTKDSHWAEMCQFPTATRSVCFSRRVRNARHLCGDPKPVLETAPDAIAARVLAPDQGQPARTRITAEIHDHPNPEDILLVPSPALQRFQPSRLY